MSLEFSQGAPCVNEMGPLFARDGDNLVLKTSLVSGQAPFSISWTLNGQPLVWSQRVTPYHKPGTIGVSLKNVCFDDEGLYSCSVSNSHGDTSFSATLVVDCKYSDQCFLLHSCKTKL